MELRLEEPTGTWRGDPGQPWSLVGGGGSKVSAHLHRSGVSCQVAPNLEEACLWRLRLAPRPGGAPLVHHHGLVFEQAQEVVWLFPLDHTHLHGAAPLLVI